MKTLLRSLLAFVITVGLMIMTNHAGAGAVSATTADATIAEIVNHYVLALGGSAALGKINSRIMRGTYAWPTKGTTAPITVYAKAPDKFALYFTDPKSTAARGYDGETAWSRDYSEQGLRILSGADLLTDKREADFYKEIRLREHYPKLTLNPMSKVNEKDVYVIQATPTEGKPETLYFDTTTGLLVRRDCERYYSLLNVEVYYDNYREVDGVKLPFTIRIVRPSIPFMNIIAFDEIKNNVRIDDAKFAKPSEEQPGAPR